MKFRCLPSPEVVHVWRLDLDRGRGNLATERSVLSDDEVARAVRYRRQSTRARFLTRRAAVRRILAEYLGVAPARIMFTYDKHGKASLPDPGYGLTFNLSHSDDVGLLAIASGIRIGVDVEKIRQSTDVEAVARTVFSSAEIAAWLNLFQSERQKAFFELWTLKEAFVKAVGTGLSFGMKSFDVSFGPGVPPALLAIGADADAGRMWSLASLQPQDGYAGAVAAQVPQIGIACFDYPESS